MTSNIIALAAEEWFWKSGGRVSRCIVLWELGLTGAGGA